MSKVFYLKLAAINIRKNAKTYIPYIITCIFTIMMFYNMYALSRNTGLNKMQGADSLKMVLAFGNIVIAIFSVIFIFYTNSFLIKKRKNEFGLYNVLGLEKRHIAKILFWENVMTIMLAIVIGLCFGILINKVLFLLLLKLIGENIPLGFSISNDAIIITLVLFLFIFLIVYVFNLLQIRLANPIQLINGSNQGEKEPKTKWILSIIGIVSLVSGYIIAIKVEHPLAALQLFFIAVILVIIGTYALFTAGSIAILKMLRSNKNFYYKTNNFISISGMMYRMKQNAVGLANICILSTMVLVMISTTVSLYVGIDDSVKSVVNRDLRVEASVEENFSNVESLINNSVDMSKVKDKLDYKYVIGAFDRDNDKFKYSSQFNSGKSFELQVISVADYNKLSGENKKLNDDEVIISSGSEKYSSDKMIINSNTFKVKESIKETVISSRNIDDGYKYVVISNNINILGDDARVQYNYSFNYNSTKEDIIKISNDMSPKIMELGGYISNIPETKQLILGLYGGLFFLGIFLGVLFLMATVLIIYYKQISEGFEDKKRFVIMQKVGMDKKEIKKTIRRQILMMFFLPIVTAIIHIVFAFPLIRKLFLVLNMTNTNLFMMTTAITALAFTLIYAFVFMLTAKTYYKIVK